MLNRVLNIGVTDDLDFYQKREVRVLNLFATLTIAGAVAGTINNLVVGEVYPAITVFFEMLASACVIVLNARKKYHLSDFTFIIAMNLTLYYMNSYYGGSAGNYLYYFPLIFCIALLHNPTKGRKREIIFFSIVLLSFVLSKLPSPSFIGNANLSEAQRHVVFTFNLYLSVVLTLLLVYLVIRLISWQYVELTDLLRQSEDDKLTIENSLKEKEVLLAEVQHRVKNNLSVLIGLFNMQKNNTSNEEAISAIREAKDRVLSIAMVHEKLYRKDNLSRIDLRSYLSELTREIISGHPLSARVTVKEDLDEIIADITKAVPVGLIVNESLTNSLKHAFKSTEHPEVRISCKAQFGQISIKISDNGPGFPSDKKRNDKSMGLSLIESLAEQIDGEIRYSNGSESGAVVKLTVPA